MRALTGSDRTRLWVIGAVVAACALVPPALARRDAVANATIVELQRNYRSQPICERINLQVRAPAVAASSLPRVARSALVLRMDLEPRGIDDVPILSADLGTMVVTASKGQVIVTHPRDATLYFEAAFAGPLATRSLAQVLQPIPLPPLDLAAAAAGGDGLVGAQPCSEFWPYATNIRWTTVEIDGRAPSRKVVNGEFDGGTVRLTMFSGRLRALTIERREPRTVMQFTFTPTGPCEPQRMFIDTSRRSRVAALPDLRPRATMIRIGAKAPRMPISVPGGGDWTIADILDPPPEAVIAGMPAADFAVLVLTRPIGESGMIPGLPRLDLARLAEVLRQMRTVSFQPAPAGRLGEPDDPMARFGFARVLVMKEAAPDQVLAQMRAAQGRWQGHLLWTTEPGATIELLAPGAEAAVVILDREEVLRASWPIESGQTAEQVTDQIQAALYELAPTENKPGAAPNQP